MQLDRKTRKNVLDWLRVEGVRWAGRLSEDVFLDRVVDLDALPSTDGRFSTARQDILQHTVFNDDWQDSDWVFTYEPLALLKAPDDVFLTFLIEMLHPVVRPDSEEARRLAQELNDLLRSADVELFESASIGTKPVWSARTLSSGAARKAERSRPAQVGGLDRLWVEGKFRLFLSHTSANKAAVGALKQALAPFGVSAFVAHMDIEPTLEWLAEIDTALRTMDAMVALLTTDFHSSKWTDQEVGYALGQGLLVVAVELPTTPYGFMGKNQGLQGDLKQPAALADSIVDVLLKRAETASAMREAVVATLERSASFGATRAIVNRIVVTDRFTDDQVARLETAMVDNSQVGQYGGIHKLASYIETLRTVG